MNLLLLAPDELIGERQARVDGRRARHLREILGAAPGVRIRAGVLDGPLGSALVTALEPGGAVELELELDSSPPPRPTTTVILAMVRPQIAKRTLAHLAALGTRRILLVGSARVEKAYFSQRLFDGDEAIEHLRLGLEQARDTWLPELQIHRRFKPFIEDVLPPLLDQLPRRYVAHPEGEGHLGAPAPEPTALAIGPEGGWSDYEVSRFADLGFRPLSLGPRILKVETAIPYLFGALGL